MQRVARVRQRRFHILQYRTISWLKPQFHVQLLHAIILGSAPGYRRQLVCVCDVTSEMSADEELLLLSAAVSAAAGRFHW